MLYTLLKFLGWGLLLALVGGCIGWALRALKSRGEVAAALSSGDGADDVESMRHRLADLEQIVAERDRLRIQLADVRHADSPGIVGADVPVAPEPATTDVASDASDIQDVADGEVDESDDADEPDEPDDAEHIDDAEHVDSGSDVLDLDAAEATLGKRIRVDDLSVVEGIGPKISELCRGIGVTSWSELADTDVADLRSMLDAAGSRYAVHDPHTWPQQAALLAAGRWDDFQAFNGDHGGAG